LFSETELNRIRDAIDLVELIGEYVALKKAGQGYVGLCPFHGEKTPSFHVHPAKQIFHCFGCQKGGNLFSFLCAVEGLPFPEAVQKLAKRAGITLEESSNRKYKPAPQPPKNERVTTALEWAAKYFHYLLNEVPEYRSVKQYVLGRGLSQASIDKFRIGVSPRGWNTLMDLMMKRQFTWNELVEAGLVVAKEESPKKGYDRFRERLMFPIRNAEGSVIAFGARLLDDEKKDQPKYINSPESPLFSKRQTFYGIHENQRGIRLRGETIIVEGYMDVIGLYEKGVNNALATMGTALTEEHCSLLKGLTQRVVTVFDPDEGGQEASRRSIHLFLSHGIFAKDLALPPNTDPDEFIQKEGAETFYSLCERAPRQITKLLKDIASQGPLSEQETARLLEELTPILVASRRLPDRALLWDNISLILKISMEALKELSEGALARQTPKAAAQPQPAAHKVFPKRSAPPKTPTLDPLDLEFLRAAVRAPKSFLALPAQSWQAGIKEPRIRVWLLRLAEAHESEQWASVLQDLALNEGDETLQGLATAQLMKPSEGTNLVATEGAAPAVEIEPLFERLQQRQKEVEIKSLSAQVRLTERLGNDEEGMRLLERLKALRST
jgi:DNA primase